MLSGKGVVALAVVLGLATSFMVWYYVDRATAQARPIRMVPVVIATRDIAPRTIITSDMVKLGEMPSEARHPAAFTDAGAPVGKISKHAMSSDEQILSTKFFTERKESGLAFLVPPGKRAVSVGISEVIGSGGMIVPGDKVDVVVVYEEKTVGRNLATIALQNVEVLAVAQLLEGDEHKSSASRSLPSISLDSGMNAASGAIAGADAGKRIDPSPQPSAKTVTLSVSPEEAARLILSEERGTIRLALRPYGDSTIIGPVDVTLPVYSPPAAPAPAAPAPAGR